MGGGKRSENFALSHSQRKKITKVAQELYQFLSVNGSKERRKAIRAYIVRTCMQAAQQGARKEKGKTRKAPLLQTFSRRWGERHDL